MGTTISLEVPNMADTNTSVSAISTDNLEIDSYDDVVKLLGADVAASMLADVVGDRFNRDDIKKAILNGGDIHLDYCRMRLRRTARRHLARMGRGLHRRGENQDARGADFQRPLPCRRMRADG